MPDKGWKQYERRIAKRFGLKRRGADFRGPGGGKDDAVALPGEPESVYSLEMTLQKVLSYIQLLAKCYQAEANASSGKVPLVIAKQARQRDRDSLVVMRLETFEEFFEIGARLEH